jgi:adenylylsulfate kinase/bifunctional enzyme CysN/CysC
VPENGAGCVVWLTGLPGAGKSTLARLIEQRLVREGRPVVVIDGDAFRREQAPGLGYSPADRALNVERMAEAGLQAALGGSVALVAAIAPYAATRSRARQIVEECSRYLEVHVHAPLETCIGRDPKGLYRRALAGEIAQFTGISDAYEEPLAPDVRIDTSLLDELAAAELVYACL